jgi:hypothetical protein
MSSSIVTHWLGEVAAAALPFESRWTWLALRRVDDDLGRRLFEQRGLFDQACITGTEADVETHGAAMCRGYAAAVRALEQAGAEDDSYMLGQCPRTGFRIAIGHQKAALARVREIHGDTVCWVTPDELAGIMANVEAFKSIAVVKRFFPGADIIDFHPTEPAKAESGVA